MISYKAVDAPPANLNGGGATDRIRPSRFIGVDRGTDYIPEKEEDPTLTALGLTDSGRERAVENFKISLVLDVVVKYFPPSERMRVIDETKRRLIERKLV